MLWPRPLEFLTNHCLRPHMNKCETGWCVKDKLEELLKQREDKCVCFRECWQQRPKNNRQQIICPSFYRGAKILHIQSFDSVLYFWSFPFVSSLLLLPPLFTLVTTAEHPFWNRKLFWVIKNPSQLKAKSAKVSRHLFATQPAINTRVQHFINDKINTLKKYIIC